jgi:hypothetical protein
MSSLGIVHYHADPNDRKKKLVQLTDICFPFSKVAASATATDDPFRASTPPMSSHADDNAMAFL